MTTEAEAHLQEASKHLAVVERQNLKDPTLLTCAQQAVECALKAVYTLLGLRFRLGHQALQALSKEDGAGLLQEELRSIRATELPLLYPYGDQLPRVVFLAFAWSRYREMAERGAEALGKPPGFFLGREEARTALEQARLCHKAAKSLLELKKEPASRRS